MRNRIFAATIVVLALSGCALNSGVTPIGQETFLVSRQAASGFSGKGTLMADALREANQYCSSQQKSLSVVDTNEAQPPFVLGNYPKADVRFICFDPKQIDSIIAECDEKRLKKEIKGFKASVECSSPRVKAAWRERRYPYMDLIDLQEAARLVGAENLDKGKITEAEYKLQLAELRSRIAAESQRRLLAVANTQAAQAQAQAANSQAQAANMQAAGALLQGLGAFQAANRPAPVQMPAPARTLNTNCQTYGTNTSCQTR
jgi:hypothetical protein